MSPKSLWYAIDTIAEQNGKSLSGLAKMSKLNLTTFNPCKRVCPDGRVRWPTFETVNKVCNATNISLFKFLRIASEYEK